VVKVSFEDLFLKGRCGPFYLGQTLEEFCASAEGVLGLPDEMEFANYKDGELFDGMYDLRNVAGFIFQPETTGRQIPRLCCIHLYLDPVETEDTELMELDIDFEGLEKFMPISQCAPIFQRYGMHRVKYGEDFVLQWYAVGKFGTLFFEDFEESKECKITAIEVHDGFRNLKAKLVDDEWNS